MSYATERMDTPIAERPADARARFIARTYAHVAGAIAAFTLIEVALFTSGMADSLAPAMLRLPWLAILGIFMVVSWLGTHLAHSARSLAAQYAGLAVGVLAYAFIFVPMLWAAMAYEPTMVSSAAITTLCGAGCLTGVAFVTRKDFSFLRGILMWGGIAAILLIVMGVLFGFHLGTFFSVAMIAFAGAAILYDTSNILHHYPEDQYVGASLALFCSVALMFWYVLRLFMSRD